MGEVGANPTMADGTNTVTLRTKLPKLGVLDQERCVKLIIAFQKYKVLVYAVSIISGWLNGGKTIPNF
jgi:hypothetical protein